MDYLILAFYILTDIDQPKEEVKRWTRFLKKKEVRARIYINEMGINAQMSLAEKEGPEFRAWLLGDKRYEKAQIKVHRYPEHVFPKLTVKYRPQLVAIDCDCDLSNRGTAVSSDEWVEMLEKRDPDTLLLDIRNDYEWEVGHFEGAAKPPFKTFRDFRKYARELRCSFDTEKTTLMMYCTGGIRCEVYSSLMKQLGFKKVYQLSGGVIQYGLERGNEWWKGNLFVFDDRLVVPITEHQASEIISHCFQCGEKVDTYYNCANMDCNALFISCKFCAQEMKGCCTNACRAAFRVRPFEAQGRPKPFRKLPYEEKVRFKQGQSS